MSERRDPETTVLARLAETRGEEVLQLLFVAQQDLREVVAGDHELLDSALARVAEATALVRDDLIARRAELREHEPVAADDLARPPAPGIRRRSWTSADAWLVVTGDSRVLAVSDLACRVLEMPRRAVVNADLAIITRVAPSVVDEALGEAGRLGHSVRTVQPRGTTDEVRVDVQRLPDTGHEQPSFVILFRLVRAGG